jgi:hypothetical protein
MVAMHRAAAVPQFHGTSLNRCANETGGHCGRPKSLEPASGGYPASRLDY